MRAAALFGWLMVVWGLNVTVLCGREELAVGASSGAVSVVSAIAVERLWIESGKRVSGDQNWECGSEFIARSGYE